MFSAKAGYNMIYVLIRSFWLLCGVQILEGQWWSWETREETVSNNVDQWFLIKGNFVLLTPKGHLAILERFLVFTAVEGECYWHVVGRGQGCY